MVTCRIKEYLQIAFPEALIMLRHDLKWAKVMQTIQKSGTNIWFLQTAGPVQRCHTIGPG